MKAKVFLLTLSITILALGSCKPTVPDKPFSFERVEYTLKGGHTEDELEGAPWINANIPGQVQMVEQPSVKDDFYTAANYDMFINGEYGPFDLSSLDVRNVCNGIYTGSAQPYPNKGMFDRTRDLMGSGSVSTLRTYLDNLDVEDFLYSKDVFLGTCGLLRVVNYDGVYDIEFNDGLTNGVPGYQSMVTIAELYSQYSQLNDFAIYIAASIYNALGYSNAQTMAEVGNEYVYKLIFADDVQYTNYRTVGELDIAGLKSALLDAGLSSSDRITIPQGSYASIVSLYNIIDSDELTQYTCAIKNILAFERRHVLGISAYKPISAYTYQLRFLYPDELNLNWYDTFSQKCYMALMLLPLIFERGYLYFAGNPDVKETVANLIEDILEEYKNMISGVKWLHDKSREAIIKKLDKMDYTSCYSDKIKNLSTIDETGLNTWNLLDVYNAYQYNLLDACLNGQMETNPTLLYSGMNSYITNAFYSPDTNEFVILNGLLSGGFVSDEIEITYARVGTVIGHEISHAFDSSGAYYNEKGQYKPTGWWEKEDMNEFKNRVKKLRKFWNNIRLHDFTFVNGTQIDGEATADMGGVAVMLALAKKIKNFDYDKFFRAYASLWKEEYSDLSSIDRDSHPYAYLRCNVTLAQFDEFVKTYHLKSGDGMYIPKDERVKIW